VVNTLFIPPVIQMGGVPQARAMLELLIDQGLFVVFLFCFVLSLHVSARQRLHPGRLFSTPLNFRNYYLSELFFFLLHPLTLLSFLFCITVSIPLFFFGGAGGSIYILLCIFLSFILVSWSLSYFLMSFGGSGLLKGAFRYLFIALLVLLMIANLEFSWDDTGAWVSVLTRKYVLYDSAGQQSLFGGLLTVLPGRLVADRLTGELVAGPLVKALFYPVGAVLASALLSGFVYIRGVLPGKVRSAGMRNNAAVTGTRSLRSKDAAHLFRRPRFYGAVLAGIGTCIYFGLLKEKAVSVPLAGIWIIFSILSFYGTNFFGHEGSGAMRYFNGSIRFRDVIRAKQSLYCMLVLVCIVPVLCLVLVHMDAETIGRLSATAALSLVVFLIAGLFLSIYNPARQDEGAGVRVIISIGAVLLPWLLWRQLDRLTLLMKVSVFGALIIAGLLVYYRLLKRIEHYFTHEETEFFKRIKRK
jgi:hypothetical protein